MQHKLIYYKRENSKSAIYTTGCMSSVFTTQMNNVFMYIMSQKFSTQEQKRITMQFLRENGMLLGKDTGDKYTIELKILFNELTNIERNRLIRKSHWLYSLFRGMTSMTDVEYKAFIKQYKAQDKFHFITILVKFLSKESKRSEFGYVPYGKFIFENLYAYNAKRTKTFIMSSEQKIRKQNIFNIPKAIAPKVVKYMDTFDPTTRGVYRMTHNIAELKV